MLAQAGSSAECLGLGARVAASFLRSPDLTDNRLATCRPAGNVPRAVTSREEVRPMNATTWVLPLPVTGGRLS